jgi:lipopolysaccharide transport system ATP-binding protein
MSKVIEINNLSKVYDLGLVGTGTLSKDLNRSLAKMRGKPDPYATIVELNDRTQKSLSNVVYALKDINFSVEQGEVLGIIGKNGAGKSTLLKILSQITSPTTGTIKMKGRIASLLEVGTGMHPEMTARQNIYLNGSLMGMHRHEITSKLDEIVDFAGIEKYIDTPTKRFSSGMTVRLGFAIAAHLEPEILVVDEVLAVGDIEFQKKAIGKIQDISENRGRTIIVVSHNMSSIARICSRAILLDKGTIVSSGDVAKVVQNYVSGDNLNSCEKTWNENKPSGDGVILNSIKVKQDLSSNIGTISNNIEKDIFLQFDYSVLDESKKLYCGFFLSSSNGYITFISSDFYEEERFNKSAGNYQSICKIPGNTLAEDTYFIRAVVAEPKQDAKPIIHIDLKDVLSFQVVDKLTGNSARKNHVGAYPGAVRPILKWELNVL